MKPVCPYCGLHSEKVDGSKIYPHRPALHHKMFWACMPCGAWVGCYVGGDKPLGRLANKQLRVAKMKAHEAFDPLWCSGKMTRTQAYTWLSEKLGIAFHKCHIGMFDLAMCERVVNVIKESGNGN